MKALKLFSMAALALVMAACAKEANFPNEPKQQSGMHFHATLMAPNSGTDTKTVYTQVGTTIHVAWKVGDQIAVICNGVKDVVTVTAVDGSGKATIEGTITSSPADDANVLMYYPAAFVSGMDELVPIFDYSKWESQDGTLDYIQDHLDVRHATPQVTVSGSDVTLKGSVSMESDAAIWKVSLTKGSDPLEATALKVRVGGTTVAAATSTPAKKDYYIGLIPEHMGTGDLAIDAKVGTDTYRYMKASGVTLDDSKYYESTVTMMSLLQTPLTIEAITAGTIVVSNPQSGMKYSKNGGDKTAVPGEISVVAGDKVAFYGNGIYYESGVTETSIGGTGTAKVKIYGNIMSLVSETGFASAKTVPADQSFESLFSFYTNLIDASGLQLPATTLSINCYAYLFKYCTQMTEAPELPATVLSTGCYYSMFSDCNSLTEAPELPATALAKNCYAFMFYYCTGLTKAPELKAETLAENCYDNMFTHCTSLTTAPVLSATTLANECCHEMFYECTSLTEAPVLPATTLAENCYAYMFYDCIGLTAAPTLPATTLAASCYYGMFQGCINLTTAPALPTTTLTNHCYGYMFKDCTKLTAAPELPATTLTQSCYIGMFSGCEKLSSVTCLATNISASGCTENWLSGVAATGTFTKAASMTGWDSGDNGIPSVWTVVDYVPVP